MADRTLSAPSDTFFVGQDAFVVFNVTNAFLSTDSVTLRSVSVSGLSYRDDIYMAGGVARIHDMSEVTSTTEPGKLALVSLGFNFSSDVLINAFGTL